MTSLRLLAAVAVLLTGCAGTATRTAAPAASPVTASTPATTTPPATAATPATAAAATSPPPRPVVPAWVVGASPLPRGSGGFGKVLPTPRALRDRHLQAVDVLPPPADGAFHAWVGPITAALLVQMGETYRPGCPVGPAALRHLTLVFRGFDGRVHTGELVVAAAAAPQVVAIFRRLFALGFPIEQMRLPTTADLTAAPTGDGNDTAAFVCRTARGQTRYSAHAYGLAIDVNPFQNPFVRGDLVLPELAGSYTDRGRLRAGMFEPGSAAVRAFTREGWTWGGTFSRPKDYQHFSLTGD